MRWPGKSGGAIGFALIFLPAGRQVCYFFLSRKKVKKNILHQNRLAGYIVSEFRLALICIPPCSCLTNKPPND